MHADVIVVGAGFAGLVATVELADAGHTVLLVDGEPLQSLGGQAHWSFGGLFLVSSPERRRLGVRDSDELALADWLGSAAFDRPEDYWPRLWAEAYVHSAAAAKRRGCTTSASSGPRLCSGPSAAATPCRAMATQSPLSMSPGAPDPAWSHRSSPASCSHRGTHSEPPSRVVSAR